MQQAAYLQKGDKVSLLSTARKISREEMAPAIRTLESWGLEVSLGEQLFSEDRQFAGTQEQRTQGLQEALDDPDCKAIICARGGYGTVQLIDGLDFSRFLQQPKWIVGYSDVTVLHNHLSRQWSLESLHATMPINFPKEGSNEAVESLHKALFGETLRYTFEIGEQSMLPVSGTVAPLVGGNFSIIYSLTGTASQLDTHGKWLLLEDLDEYLYHIDRMLINLRRAGVLDGCKGLLIGGMSDMNDNAIPYGETAEEIIRRHARELSLPIVFGIPSGHIERNLAMIMCREAELRFEGSKGILQFHGRA